MQQDKVFFKIIVPNYNNMAYVKICLDSIIKQTYQDFKIVFIDDLSDDMSFEFALMYQRKFPQKVVALRVEKKGYAGHARNVGLDYQLDSEYTWFIDSDDWMVDKNVLKKLHQIATTLNYPDVIRCPLLHYFGGKKSEFYPESKKINDIAIGGAGPSKNCIRSKKFLHIRFKEDRALWNDVVWFLRLLDNVDINKIAVCDSPLYCYNRASVTSSTNSEKQYSDRCIKDMIALHDDLLNEKYNHEYCNVEKKRMMSWSHRIKEHYITVDSFIENSYVISIDKSRHSTFLKLFSKVGFEKSPLLLVGHQDKNLSSTKNCLMSHYTAVKNAKDNGLPFVVVFEDDAYPCINLKQKLQEVLRLIPQDANAVLLGYSSCSYKLKKSMQRRYFNKIIDSTVSGAHAYIVFERAYDKYLKFFQKNGNRPADNFIFFEMNPSYVLKEPLFIQYCKSKSMHDHYGYIFEGNKDTPPINFQEIEKYGIEQ